MPPDLLGSLHQPFDFLRCQMLSGTLVEVRDLRGWNFPVYSGWVQPVRRPIRKVVAGWSYAPYRPAERGAEPGRGDVGHVEKSNGVPARVGRSRGWRAGRQRLTGGKVELCVAAQSPGRGIGSTGDPPRHEWTRRACYAPRSAWTPRAVPDRCIGDNLRSPLHAADHDGRQRPPHRQADARPAYPRITDARGRQSANPTAPLEKPNR